MDDMTGVRRPGAPGRAERRRLEEAARRRRRVPPGAGFERSLALTALGALLPGSAFIAVGRGRLGAVVLGVALSVAAVVFWLATGGQRAALYAVVNPSLLRLIGVLFVVLAVAWVSVIASGYHMLRPARTTSGQRLFGSVFVGVLCLAVAAPMVMAANYALIQRDLITTVFAGKASATTPDNSTDADPWAGTDRVNLMLLGGDGGVGRDGVRTDTVIVASIDTQSGDTALLSLPRNLQNVPFPPGPLRDAYPDGFVDPGGESESLLNAIYRNVPAADPDILGPTDNVGADALKLAVGESLGLRVDYYMLVNLEGFTQLVDALGGVEVNINSYVPIGGITDLGVLPDDYLRPGPNQQLDGEDALWFARGRFGSSDYDRMDRQRCVIDAIIEEADPVTLLRRYQQLAETTKDIIETDIPQSLLDDFVDLSFLIKDAEVTSIVFDDTVITPAYADYDQIRALVEAAIDPQPPPAASTSAPPSTETALPTDTADPTGTAVPTEAIGKPEELGSSCAYDPIVAGEALSEGEPPTRSR